MKFIARALQTESAAKNTGEVKLSQSRPFSFPQPFSFPAPARPPSPQAVVPKAARNISTPALT